MIAVHDDVLPNPVSYRARALEQPYASVTLGPVTFHGIAPAPSGDFAAWFVAAYPQYVPTVSFVRKSPAGQVEPNLIHTDADMGDLTALLYLTPDPPVDDGTSFWQHTASGATSGDQWLTDGHDLTAWTLREHAAAKFNRAVVFSAPLFHARALEGNYGAGDDARLVQVLFATVKE